MISRKTTQAVAGAYARKFSSTRSPFSVYKDSLYDFLYENDYQAWFCNAARRNRWNRELKDWVLKIHTGETLVKSTPNWTFEQREKLGQRYLRDLAETFLRWFQDETDHWQTESLKELHAEIIRRLELDGYVFRDNVLYHTAGDVLSVDQERTLLQHLHIRLSLPDSKMTFDFLDLSEKHFVDGNWSDSIANARKFFESIMKQAAAAFADRKLGSPLGKSTLSRPVNVRRFLEDNGILEHREREAVDKAYGLLSHTGGHPYMAESDQARLLRQLSLILTQFVLLRMEGALK